MREGREREEKDERTKEKDERTKEKETDGRTRERERERQKEREPPQKSARGQCRRRNRPKAGRDIATPHLQRKQRARNEEIDRKRREMKEKKK